MPNMHLKSAASNIKHAADEYNRQLHELQDQENALQREQVAHEGHHAAVIHEHQAQLLVLASGAPEKALSEAEIRRHKQEIDGMKRNVRDQIDQIRQQMQALESAMRDCMRLASDLERKAY